MNNKRGITLLNYNFKGGVGKTTLTGMQAYLIANKNKKVLLIDMDPQANLTEMMSETYHKKLDPVIDLYDGFSKGNLKNTLVHVSNNIDILPADWNLNKLINKLAPIKQNSRWNLLRNMLEPFKSSYDYILLDVPPTLNDIVTNAIFAADGISIVLETQKMAYTSALKTLKQLIVYRNKYNAKFRFLGVVLYLFNKAKIDKEITKAAQKTLKGALFVTPIRFQERVKGFTANGIREHDFWDTRVIENYKRVNNEILDSVKKMILNGWRFSW